MTKNFQLFTWTLLLAFAGCGTSNPFDSVPVEGMVDVNGNPMPEISVTFIPRDGHGLCAGGLTDENGKFVLTLPAAPVGSGVLEGEYDVTFSKYKMEGQELNAEQYSDQIGNQRPRKTFLIPERYSSPKTSGLEPITVKKKERNVFNFNLQSQ